MTGMDPNLTAPVPSPENGTIDDADDELWRDLLLLIETGQVVPIVGRELLEVGPPGQTVHLYSWLATRVAAKLGVAFNPAEPTTDPLNTVACRYLAKRDDPRRIYVNLFEEAKGLPALGIPEGLLKLAAIDQFKLFVTTTFDGSLQAALDQVRFNGLPRTDIRTYAPTELKDLPGSLDELKVPTVFHLLGRISPTENSYVVTEEDALEFVHSLQSVRPSVLFGELYRKDLLVIGCRFPTWLVRSFLRLARPERLLLARGRTMFVVDSGAREDRALIDFLRAFKTRTEVFQKKGAIAFVNELHARWQQRPGRVQSTPADISPAEAAPEGAIFLSYASEDRQVVQTIAAALREAHLDVWLDRDQLMAGDSFEDRIRTNIRRSGLFVPVLSRRCLDRGQRYFRLEWKHAFQKASALPKSVQFIFPVVIDDLPYQSEALPSELTELTWFSLVEGINAKFVDDVKNRYKRNQAD
jgi:hypothetical protein